MITWGYLRVDLLLDGDETRPDGLPLLRYHGLGHCDGSYHRLGLLYLDLHDVITWGYLRVDLLLDGDETRPDGLPLLWNLNLTSIHGTWIGSGISFLGALSPTSDDYL